MLKHPVTGQFIPAAVNVVGARIPIVIGGSAPVEPPVLKWFNGPAPKDAADEYARARYISRGAAQATLTGGTVMSNAAALAAAEGKTLDPERGIS